MCKTKTGAITTPACNENILIAYLGSTTKKYIIYQFVNTEPESQAKKYAQPPYYNASIYSRLLAIPSLLC
jgi:hypothetical protein